MQFGVPHLEMNLHDEPPIHRAVFVGSLFEQGVETAPTRITVGPIGEGASFAAPPAGCTLRPVLRRRHPLEQVSCEK